MNPLSKQHLGAYRKGKTSPCCGRHGVGEGEVGGESLFFFLLFLLLFFSSPLSFPQDQLQDALEGGEGRGAGMRVHVRIREEREGRSTHPWGERELEKEAG